MARRLSSKEISSYDVIPPELASKVKIVTVPILPPNADGMTVGNYIFLKKDDERLASGDRTLLAHELVHVRQYDELGPVGFLAQYLKSYTKNLVKLRNHRQAYLNIPLEMEARKVAERWAKKRRRSPEGRADDEST